MLMFAGILDAPSTGSLIFATILVAAGWLWLLWLWWSSRPGRIMPGPSVRPETPLPDSLEPPAVVALLTNGFEAPPSAVTGTVLDLAARNWLRLTATDGELVVVTSGTPATGDVMTGYEQQVFNHLASRAFNDYTSAGTLAVGQSDIDARWRWRFRRAVADDSQRRGLTVDRYPLIALAVAAAAALVTVLLLIRGVVRGDETAIVDSLRSRLYWFAVFGGAAGLLAATWRRYSSAAQLPTDVGAERASAWLGYRQRLADRIPANASVIGTPDQQRALGNAVVTGVAEHVFRQVPIVRPGARRGWSEAGGIPHVVGVHYPVRPGYGQHPMRVAIVGVVGIITITWLRGFLSGVADGTRLASLLDKLPGGISVIERIAEFLNLALVLPLIPLYWCAFAGLVDMVVSHEKVGAVVRSRPPEEVLPSWMSRIVKPFGSRSGYLSYLALDEGNHDVTVAALANDRTATPQGAQARITVTPLLGYIHHTEPIGTAGNLLPDEVLGQPTGAS